MYTQQQKQSRDRMMHSSPAFNRAAKPNDLSQPSPPTRTSGGRGRRALPQPPPTLNRQNKTNQNINQQSTQRTNQKPPQIQIDLKSGRSETFYKARNQRHAATWVHPGRKPPSASANSLPNVPQYLMQTSQTQKDLASSMKCGVCGKLVKIASVDEHSKSCRAYTELLSIPNDRKTIHTKNYGVKLCNFRDIGGWEVFIRDKQSGIPKRGRVRQGLIFRSSSINRADADDAEIIVKKLGIKSLLDLRTAEFSGKRGPHLCPYFEVVARAHTRGIIRKRLAKRSDQRTLESLDRDDRATTSSSQDSVDDDSSGDDTSIVDEEAAVVSRVDWGRCFRVGLVGNQFKREVIAKTPKGQLAKAGWFYFRGKSAGKYREAVVGHIFNRADGLDVLYQMFVDLCQDEVLRFLTTLTNVAELPAVFYCNHGKDRTGFMAMLILSICGVKKEYIIENYALSDELLKPISHHVDSEMEEGGLVPQIMARSPPSAMRNMFSYIERKYESVERFLEHIGFSKAQQESLRFKLVDFADRPRSHRATLSPNSGAQSSAMSSASSQFKLSISSGEQKKTSNNSLSPRRGGFLAAPTTKSPRHSVSDEVFERQTSATSRHVVWEPQQADVRGLLPLPKECKPLKFSGFLDVPGRYELRIYGADLEHSNHLYIMCMFKVKSANPKCAQAKPPFTLHRDTTVSLCRPFFLQQGTKCEWFLTVQGSSTLKKSNQVSLRIVRMAETN